MNDDEIQLWSDMLQYAISATQSISIRPVVIVEEIFLQLSKHKVNRSVWWTVSVVYCLMSGLQRSLHVIDFATLLVSNINLPPSEPVPEELFMIIDDILQHLYLLQ